MKVAILGARGIPACYSGYDTLVEELAERLVASNCEVIVYCRNSYFDKKPKIYKGVSLFYLPAPRLKAFESLLHSFLSSIHVLFQNADLIYFLDPANAPFCLFLKLFGKRVVIHTDGLGWKRKKWGFLERRYYKFVEFMSALAANALVTDNKEMQRYYQKEYKVNSAYIPYGASHFAGVDKTVYNEFNLKPDNYLLVVARLEPENNTDIIIREFVDSEIKLPLVVVGDSPYDPDFLNRLRSISNENVRFLGRINDQSKLNALYQGAYLYIHGHEVGGTNPSLLRAMDAGTAPLAINSPFNLAVISKNGFIFNKNRGNLASQLNYLANEHIEVKTMSAKAQHHSQVNFRWDKVAQDHIYLFNSVLDF